MAQRKARTCSKIIKTIQGTIIDFSKFAAEENKNVKCVKNYSKNLNIEQEKDALNVKNVYKGTEKKENKSACQRSPKFVVSTDSNFDSLSTDLDAGSKETVTTFTPKVNDKGSQSVKKLYPRTKATEKPVTKPRKSCLKRKQIVEMQSVQKNVQPAASKSSKLEPPCWQQVFKNLKEMKKNWNAPVDSMGCDKCPDQTASTKDKRYQSLLGLMLSSQTKDQVTHAAMQRLIEHGCTVEKISATSEDELGKLIYPVSFWKNKASYIKKTTEVLKAQYDSDIPQTVDELIKLPGVGPKMAHLCMQFAWDEITGIGVDTHVHRISNRLGWVNTKTPEQTRIALESWLPKEHWAEINTLLVGFGQTTCTSDKPKCGSCMNNTVCPSASEFM